MTAVKRPPRRTAAPAALSVPRVRAIRSDDDVEPMQPQTPIQARPRRNRKPKFVF
jgi:hypothetical protein